MTAQQLITEYCTFYGLNRYELAHINEQRHERMNGEFDCFFDGKEITEETLSDYYTTAEELKHGLLHCAVSEIQSGQAAWVQKTIRDSKAETVLDYGCGLSPAVGPLAEQGVNVSLADIPGKHVEFLEALYPQANFVPIGSGLTTETKHDVVVCQEVFEHTADPLATARKVLEFVAPGGLAILSWCFHGSHSNHLHLSHNEYQGHDEQFLTALQELGWEAGSGYSAALRVWRRA